MASALIMLRKEHPTSPEPAELTYYQELFAILATAPTTTTWTTSQSDRLEYVTEPLALALVLYVVKDANTGTRNPLPGTSQQWVQRPTDYRGSTTPALSYTETPALLKTLIEAMNGGILGFRKGANT
jgi:hypothetical protein